MTSPAQQAGAVSGQSKYAGVGMPARQFTGLITQAVPYSDAGVPYLVAKFYSGSRYDRIIDGLNREIGAKLSDVRSPGSSVWNANTFPEINSYFFWKYIQDGVEKIRVIVDGQDGTIYDATAGAKIAIATKPFMTPKARFLSVSNELFLYLAGQNGASGIVQKLLAANRTWQATTSFVPGQLLVSGTGSGAGFVQMGLGGITMKIVASASDGTYVTLWVDPTSIPAQLPNLTGVSVTFSGLGAGAVLNATTEAVYKVVSTNQGIFQVAFASLMWDKTTESSNASGTTGTGTSGGTQPAFSTTEYVVVADAGQQWKCYGSALQQASSNDLFVPGINIAPQNGSRFWQPNKTLGFNYAILDTGGNIQVAINFTGPPNYTSGAQYPTWATAGVGNILLTYDGTIVWENFGMPGAWQAGTTFGDPSDIARIILDSNNNLQYVSGGAGGTSGGSVPTWATGIGTTTSDGALTWTCVGPGVVLSYQTLLYAVSWHSIDGTVSNPSNTVGVYGGILGKSPDMAPQNPLATPILSIGIGGTIDPQYDQTFIWRTAQGQATLVLEDQIPIVTDNTSGLNGTYWELGIPDTSANGGPALNALITAPVNGSNTAAPGNMTAPAWNLTRQWGIVTNTVVWSATLGEVTGTAFTVFPGANVATFVAVPIRLIPTTVQGGGMIVLTTSGAKIILGTGTSDNPFYVTDYFSSVDVMGYDAVDVFNQTIYLMESNGKISSLAIQYPFNPNTGYVEVGFPIGDQFNMVTTGGLNAALFNPATAYLTWNMNRSGDTGMYVSDGAGHWFRMSMVSPPESGLLWSPLRTIVGGGSAVQSVEVVPGQKLLLIGPPAGGGPILARDITGTVYEDNGAEYPAWDVKGVILLCSTGQSAEIAHISTKSKAVGARPVLSILMNEIAESPERPWQVLDNPTDDPPLNKQSKSVYSDRYVLLDQSGVDATGDAMMVKFDYGDQNAADELLDWQFMEAVTNEREEKVATG